MSDEEAAELQARQAVIAAHADLLIEACMAVHREEPGAVAKYVQVAGLIGESEWSAVTGRLLGRIVWMDGRIKELEAR